MADDARRYARKRVAVVGAGSWGTALALVAARNRHDVRVWAREPEVALSIEREHKNPFYLSDFTLPENIGATTSLEEALADTDFVLMVVPSHAMRDCVSRMKDHLKPETVIVSATKGVENGSLMRMSEVIREVLIERVEPRVVALSGPSFAREVAQKDPTAIVAASSDQGAMRDGSAEPQLERIPRLHEQRRCRSRAWRRRQECRSHSGEAWCAGWGWAQTPSRP